MELRSALRSTPATRTFTDARVSDETVTAILDDARFAPSGGNRQGWRVVLVKDPSIRRVIRDLYLPGWYEYLGQMADGITPFAPLNDRELEASARARGPEIGRQQASGPGGFAEHLDEVPVMLVVLADLDCLAAVDRDLPRYSFAGGASIYPFVWSILLAARDRGLGGVVTTMATINESELLTLLAAPPNLAVAALVALGEPAAEITRLRRDPVSAFASIDTVGGDALTS